MEFCSVIQNCLLYTRTRKLRTGVIKRTVIATGVLYHLVCRPALVSPVIIVTSISVIGDHVLRLRDRLYVMLLNASK